ncbi:MAG: DUF11 domain-containing protein [Candidatus Marinimicrobia bacterium]|nr:DUF11 domain-containing protein [Candidatus Neomarinimicrobiota bacterium]MCF7851165.1 DUF11 domain-containing protein [Candidatus Neomarinimicrobiota bacterium]
MKPTRFLTVAVILIGLTASAFAAGTPAGTTISNQATGTYKDANGNALDGVSSNTVTTTVSQVAGTSVGNDQAQNLASMSSVTYPVTLTNTGNGTDSFTLSAGTGGGEQASTYTVEVYHDVDGSGTVNAGDTLATLAEDIAADGTYSILVQVSDTTFAGAPNDDVIAVTLTSLSSFDEGVSDATVLTSTLQAAALTATVSVVDDGDPQPGETITFEVCLTNNGTATAYNVQFVNLIPTNTTYSAGTIRHGTTGWSNGSLITDTNDTGIDTYDGDYNLTTASTITVDLGDIAGGGSICIYYKVTINSGLAEGETIVNEPVIDYENGGGDPYPTVDPTDGGGGSVAISESFGVEFVATGTTSFTGDPSDSLFYAFTVENLGNGTDNFDLSATTEDFVVWTFYIDTDGSGTLSVAELAAGAVTATGDLTQNEVGDYVALGIIPAGTADAVTDATTFTAASQGDEGTSTDTGTASATCTAPLLTLVKAVDNATAAPGDTLTYTITVANSGTGVATTVVVSDVIPTNTSYVAESMTIDGSSVDDASNTDGGTLSGGSVVFDFDTMDASGGANDDHTLVFKVIVD